MDTKTTQKSQSSRLSKITVIGLIIVASGMLLYTLLNPAPSHTELPGKNYSTELDNQA